MTRLGLVLWLLAGCQTSPCGSGEEQCDGKCVPEGLVCCDRGNGAVCPMGYTCGTSSNAPCLANNATVVQINPPPATCPVQCADGGCPVTFSPSPASVRVGQQIYWENRDDTPHTMINESTQNTPITTVPANGRSSTIHFNTPGTYLIGAMDCRDPRFPGFLAKHQVVVTVAAEEP